MINVLYVDMNSYFASVEQQDRPELRRKPIAVVPVEADTTACIAASYEAKAFGVRTGTNVAQAKLLCPGLILVKARPDLYVRTHHRVLDAIDAVLPVDAIHSIDEASCRLLGVQRDPARAQELARRVKHAFAQRLGTELRCSIGLAPNRFLAKVAADMQKPDGLTTLLPSELPHRLFTLPITDLPGIGIKMAARLRSVGVYTIEHLCSYDEPGLVRVFRSVVGRDWYHRLRGHDLRELPTHRRSVGHSHVLSPEKRAEEPARGVAIRLLTKAAARARHLGYVAEHLTLSVTYLTPRRRLRADLPPPPPPGFPPFWHARAALGGTHDTPTLVRALAPLWDSKPKGPLLKLGVTLHDLVPEGSATPLLFAERRPPASLSRALDAINRKYGADTVYVASMQDARKSAPRRIAFGNIPDLDVPDTQDD